MRDEAWSDLLPVLVGRGFAFEEEQVVAAAKAILDLREEAPSDASDPAPLHANGSASH